MNSAPMGVAITDCRVPPERGLADEPDTTIRTGRRGAWSNDAANIEETGPQVCFSDAEAVATRYAARIVD
jgi:hypothetical protein